MTRIPYPDPTEITPENREFLSELPQLNISRMLAGSPSMFIPLTRLFNAYLSDGVLDETLREIAILRVGHLCKSEYEIINHERVAKLIGMNADSIAALLPGASQALFSSSERLLIRFVDEQVLDGGASAETFAALSKQLSTSELLELSAIIGVYTMVSQICSTFGIEPEETPIAITGIEDIKRSVDKLG